MWSSPTRRRLDRNARLPCDVSDGPGTSPRCIDNSGLEAKNRGGGRSDDGSGVRRRNAHGACAASDSVTGNATVLGSARGRGVLPGHGLGFRSLDRLRVAGGLERGQRLQQPRPRQRPRRPRATSTTRVTAASSRRPSGTTQSAWPVRLPHPRPATDLGRAGGFFVRVYARTSNGGGPGSRRRPSGSPMAVPEPPERRSAARARRQLPAARALDRGHHRPRASGRPEVRRPRLARKRLPRRMGHVSFFNSSTAAAAAQISVGANGGATPYVSNASAAFDEAFPSLPRSRRWITPPTANRRRPFFSHSSALGSILRDPAFFESPRIANATGTNGSSTSSAA